MCVCVVCVLYVCCMCLCADINVGGVSTHTNSSKLFDDDGGGDGEEKTYMDVCA